MSDWGDIRSKIVWESKNRTIEQLRSDLEEAERRGFMRAVEMLRGEEATAYARAEYFDNFGRDLDHCDWAKWLEERKL